MNDSKTFPDKLRLSGAPQSSDELRLSGAPNKRERARLFEEPKKKRRAADGVAQILKARRQIILALIEQAKKGSYLHAKFLFDYARISRAEDPEADREVSLAEMLLTRLREENAAAGEAETLEPGDASVL